MKIELRDYIAALNNYEFPAITEDRKLYELMLLVVSNNQKTINIVQYERPTAIEHLILRYSLRGIKVDAVTSPFNKLELEYHIIINRAMFMNNLDIFYKQDRMIIKHKYDQAERKEMEALRRKEKQAKKNGERSPFERFIITSGVVKHENRTAKAN